MYLYDDNFLKEAGVVSSGNKAIDMQMMNNRRDVYLTAVAIALYFDEGAPVKLKNPRDAIEMYRTINQHLLNWKEVINTQFNVKAPIEDLKKLDNLAVVLYPVAAQWAEFKPREIGIFDKLLKRRPGISLHSKTESPTQHKQVITGEQPQQPVEAHNPIADALRKNLFNRGMK